MNPDDAQDIPAPPSGMDSDSKNRSEMLDAMIAAGAELNPTDAGRTPLMRAIEKKDTALIDALLKRGAKVNWKNRQGLTPLMAAVVGSSPAIVKFLIVAGADVNARSNDSQTALSLAEEIYNEFKLPAQAEVVRLLSESGGQLHIKISRAFEVRTSGVNPRSRSAFYHDSTGLSSVLWFGECLNQSSKVRGIAGVLAFTKLPCIVATHEQVNGAPQGMNAPTKAA